jgi:hypothetical protein
MNEEQGDLRSEVSNHILKTLLYYDIFNYPLKDSEVFRFLGTNHVTFEFIQTQLRLLVEQHRVYQFQNFFTVQNREDLIHRRIKGNDLAEKSMTLAYQKAKLIMRFPFVRAVMASGSLSKGFMDENSDLDFFIVTEPGKLWIARTLLVLYKRLFLFNSHKYFCVNYFLDYDHLEIEEKNLFTATELATVLPLAGSDYYLRLHQRNTWLTDFFPNFNLRDTREVLPGTPGPGKRIIESVIRVMFPWLEKVFMQMTLRRWKREYGKVYKGSDFEIAFKTKSYASKNHPRHFQKKVIDLYSQKVSEYEKENRIELGV